MPFQELTPEQIRQIFSSVAIPPCPSVVCEALAETRKEHPSLKFIAAKISQDPKMAGMCMKYANSAIYGKLPPAASPLKAVERIGLNSAAAIVAACGLRSCFDGYDPAFIEKFWAKSSKIAMAAATCARKLLRMNPETAYIYALFHDAGIPLMMRRFPDYHKAFDLAQSEQKPLREIELGLFPCTHPIIGSLMVKSWGLPKSVERAIRFHHEPDAYQSPGQSISPECLDLIACAHLCEHALFRSEAESARLRGQASQGSFDPETEPALFEQAVEHFGLDAGELEELADIVQDADAL